MQDKSFLQAMQDLEERVSGTFHESLEQMLLNQTTAIEATANIKDENMREVITNTLITGQIVVFLKLMRDLQFLDNTQCNEFTTHLLHSIRSHYGDFPFLKDLS